jgi:NOL1/NOP2/fmu family ribosome biogenesis protein
MDAWPSLKPGGMMIYSTCTFNPHENEENIAWLHDRTDSESVPLDITDMDGIITIRKGDIEGYGFHPGRVKGDGFFIAVIRKTGGDIPGKKTKKTKLPKPSLRALDTIKPLLSIQPDRLLLTNDRIMALACDRELFSYISARLTVVKSGTLIGEYRNKDFIPAHDLAMSVRQHEGAWPAYDASYDEAIAFLRLDNFVISAMPIGRIQIRYRGVSLGFINNLGNRINNNYPHGWRVRMEKQNYYKEIL